MNKTAAYHEWLGIPLKDVTPNHYELLGVPLFEANTTVISNGAARRVSFPVSYTHLTLPTKA